jgi:hypothetical protein
MSDDTTPDAARYKPPPTPEAAERLLDRDVTEHAARTAEFLTSYESGLLTRDEWVAAGGDPNAWPPRPTTGEEKTP